MELGHDLRCYGHFMTLYFHVVSSVYALFDALKSRRFGLTPLIPNSELYQPPGPAATCMSDLSNAIDGFTAVNCEHWVRTLVNPL